VARARNKPRGHLALILVAIIAFLAALTVRASAQPYDSDPRDDDDRLATDARAAGGGDEDDGPGARSHGARRFYVPITSAMVERIATLAPPVRDVVAAAYRTAGVGDDPIASWRRRSRWSALIPLVSARAGQNQAWRDVEDPTISHGVGLDVRAAWHLERLLYDPNEPRIAMLDVARRRERRRVAALAIHLYFDWVAARVAANADVRAELEAQEKLAELDALTAGWFSEALAKAAELR
jgi:hypothetical protein